MFYYNQETEDPIHHFGLSGLLEEDESIAVDYQNGYISRIGVVLGRAHLKVGMQLTQTEIRVIVPILANFPYYCPHEVLHAAFTSGNMDELTVHKSRLILQDAAQNNYWNQEIRGMRGTVSRVRLKLKVFDLDIGSILKTGYVIQRFGQKIS